MRFFHVVLAASLLASVNADSTEMNQVSQLVQEIASRSVVSVQDPNVVKRNLRKYVEEKDSLDPIDALDSIDEPEERGPIDLKKFVLNTGAVQPDNIVSGDRLNRLEVNLAGHHTAALPPGYIPHLPPAAPPAGLHIRPEVNLATLFAGLRVNLPGLPAGLRKQYDDGLLEAVNIVFHQQREMMKPGAAAALRTELQVKDDDLKQLFGDDLMIYLGLLQGMNQKQHKAYIAHIMKDEYGFHKRLGVDSRRHTWADNHDLFIWLEMYPKTKYFIRRVW